MIVVKKYKSLIAAALLTLYVFIATPVQFWHHHSYAGADTASSLKLDGTQKIFSSDSSAKALEDNCQICSHHYSIYSKDDAAGFKIFNSPANSKEGFYALAIPLAPYFNSTNKGPPALT